MLITDGKYRENADAHCLQDCPMPSTLRVERPVGGGSRVGNSSIIASVTISWTVSETRTPWRERECHIAWDGVDCSYGATSSNDGMSMSFVDEVI